MKRIVLLAAVVATAVVLVAASLPTTPPSISTQDSKFIAPTNSFEAVRSQTVSAEAAVAAAAVKTAARLSSFQNTNGTMTSKASLSSGLRTAQMATATQGSSSAMATMVSQHLLNINFTSDWEWKTGMAAIGQTENDVWNNVVQLFDCAATLENLVWSDNTSSGASLVIANAPSIWGNGLSDPMYNSYWFGLCEEGPIVITLASVPAGTYDFYLYGHGPADDANSVFELIADGTSYGYRGTTVWGAGWNSTDWQEGQQYVVFRNVTIATLDPVTIFVYPGDSTYTLVNGLQIVPSGAVPTTPPAMERLLNVNFTSASEPKTGMAAVGVSASDVWNNSAHQGESYVTLNNLLWHDGTQSGANLTLQNGPGLWGLGLSDPMYNTFIYPWEEGNIIITLNNVPEGAYDLYVYGHGPSDDGNTVVDLASGTTSYGQRGTTKWGDGWNSVDWHEGQQYIVFRNVQVTHTDPLVLHVMPGLSGYVIVNGFQLAVPLDRDTDGLPDWWERKHFGSLDQPADGEFGDYDADGRSNLWEFQNDTDPNTIVFRISVTNNYVSESLTAVNLEVAKGHASSQAVLVDSDNFVGATWTPASSSSVAINLGATEGWHEVWVGLRGRSETSEQTWQHKRIKLDQTRPTLVITEPATPATISRPMIQLKGCSLEALSSISCDVSNEAGVFPDRMILVLRQAYDTNLHELTTNFFQGFDLELTNGLNVITIRAADLAGNVRTNDLNLTVVSDSTAPVVSLFWPQNGAKVSGDTFTWRGSVDDFTASLTASVTDAGAVTTDVPVTVERDGNWWVEDIPLGAGTSTVTLRAEDVWGNVTTTTISIVQSAVATTINQLSEAELNEPLVTVRGSINTGGYSVWVNGIKSTDNGDNTWTAEAVPLPQGNTAVIQARAIPNTDNGGNGTGGGGASGYSNLGNPTSAQAVDAEKQNDKPEGVYVASDTVNIAVHWHDFQDYVLESFDETDDSQSSHHWTEEDGGSGVRQRNHQLTSSLYGVTECEGKTVYTWPNSLVLPGTQMTTVTGTGDCDEGFEPGSGPTGPLRVCWQHCRIPDQNLAYAWVYPIFETLEKRQHKDADTVVRLRTGGKGKIKRNNLWVVTGHAEEVVNYWALDPCMSGVEKKAIPFEQITIGGLGKLGNDGRRYKVLPDGVTKDVTPTVSDSDYYTFGVEAKKYKLSIIADNGVAPTPLFHDRVAAYAKYSVGMRIALSPKFVPEVAGIKQKNVTWSASGQFVNYFLCWMTASPDSRSADENNYDSAWGLTQFSVEDFWLHFENTRMWWLTGDNNGYEEKTVSLKLKLTFDNGQADNLETSGKLGMHKPSVTWDSAYYQPGVMHGNIGSLGFQAVGLGLFYTSTPVVDQLRWGVSSRSLCEGRFAMIQLLTQDTALQSFSEWRLDNGVPYNNSMNYQPLSGAFVAYNVDGDGPYTPAGGYLTDNFKQYFVYRPNTPGSIWVTLGTANWNCSGRIEEHPTYWELVDAHFYHSQEVAPSSELPEWSNRKANSE